jgi:uncharacterized protein
MNVLVIGASNKPHRYSYMAIERLLKANHSVFCVHPNIKEVQGLAVINNLEDIKIPIHTISLYVSKEKSLKMVESIIKIKPQRIIFNPGAENNELKEKAKNKDIEVLDACTLILLSTGQF